MTAVDALRWILAGEATVLFLGALFIPGLYPRANPPRPILLLRWALTIGVFSTGVSVGANALLHPPATPGLYVGLVLLTPAAALVVAAVWAAFRQHPRPHR